MVFSFYIFDKTRLIDEEKNELLKDTMCNAQIQYAMWSFQIAVYIVKCA